MSTKNTKKQPKSVLPLIQGDSSPVFDPVEKFKLRQEAFLDCHQQQSDQSDAELHAKVMGIYSDIAVESDSKQHEGKEKLQKRHIPGRDRGS